MFFLWSLLLCAFLKKTKLSRKTSYCWKKAWFLGLLLLTGLRVKYYMARLRIRQRDQSSPAQDLDYSHIPYSSPTKRSRTVKAKPTIWVSNGNRFIQGVSTRLSVPCRQLGLLERPVWADDSGLEEKTESAEPAAVAEAFIPQPSLHHRK